MKQNDFQKLIFKLEQKKLSEKTVFDFFKFGKQAFDCLYEMVSQNQLSDRQTRNALHILFMLSKEHCHSEKNRLLELVLAQATNERRIVRAEAAVIAVYLTRFGEDFPKNIQEFSMSLDDRALVIPILEKAIEKGLPEPSGSYVKDFIFHKI